MATIHIIDLRFHQEEQTVAAFLIETSAGPILIETGPDSTWPQLAQGIKKLGYQPSDIHHVLLTHIHLDHAGAAWRLAKEGATIYVHPSGLAHLAQPEKLWHSARQIYGDQMLPLWGRMEPIAPDHLRAVNDEQLLPFGDVEITALFTPGHAIHHVAYQLGDAIFTGDVGGVKIGQGPVVPPCPPPDIHLGHWFDSIQKLLHRNALTLYLTHFGPVSEPAAHLAALKAVLEDWAAWMKTHYDAGHSVGETTPLFMEYTADKFRNLGLSEHQIKRYEYANPSWMSVTGLMRYWKLKEQGRIV